MPVDSSLPGSRIWNTPKRKRAPQSGARFAHLPRDLARDLEGHRNRSGGGVASRIGGSDAELRRELAALGKRRGTRDEPDRSRRLSTATELGGLRAQDHGR